MMAQNHLLRGGIVTPKLLLCAARQTSSKTSKSRSRLTKLVAVDTLTSSSLGSLNCASRGRRFFSDVVCQKHDMPRAGDHQSSIVDLLWREREINRDPGASSIATITYDFETDPKLVDAYSNPWGLIRIGRVLEDLDAFAGNIAHFHCLKESQQMMIVTAAVDRIKLLHRANLKNNLHMSGAVTWVGSSSMEISISATSAWTNEPWLQARFIYVARDLETGRAAKIPTLEPSTAGELEQFQAGEARAEARKKLRKEAYVKGILWWPSKESIEMAKDLLKESNKLRHLPSVSSGDTIFLDDTSLQNAFLCQRQMRNTHGRVFGGLLMRRGFELAFATAYLFAGSQPRFLEVDRVAFHQPVEVGNLLRFQSHVLYTKRNQDNRNEIHVEVSAWVTSPEDESSKTSNTFNFTFEAPGDVKTVVPTRIEDAHRIVTRMEADDKQGLED